MSCGVASFPVHGITAGELLHAADRALSEAKESGTEPLGRLQPPCTTRSPSRTPKDRPEHEARLASLVSLAEAVDARKGSPANSRRVAALRGAAGRAASTFPRRTSSGCASRRCLRDVGEVGVAEWRSSESPVR